MKRVSEEYVMEKIEAYNVAISALEAHESASDCDHELARKLRQRLANKLSNELDRWVAIAGSTRKRQ